MTYDYVHGERAELVVGQSVEPVTVQGRNAVGLFLIHDSAGREFGVSAGALRPVLPEPVEITDHSGDTVWARVVQYTGGLHKVGILAPAPVDLTPDEADQHADAVKAMSRAIRGREQS